MTTAGEIGENALIERIVRQLAARPDVPVGAREGDDCAVVRPDPAGASDWLLTSDPLIEGVHFLPSAAPRAIGHKGIGRVLSDLAAMGGRPRWALTNLVAPPGVPLERIEALYAGASDLAQHFGLAIVGGDVAAGPGLELHVFAVGEVPRGTALLRSGAKPGQFLYVTGELGGSSAGRHLTFTPRVEEGLWLRESGLVAAMMDISDGLATDLPRLCRCSGAGADVETQAIPLSAAARALRDGRSALDHALSDGEDFELLFTVPAPNADRFERAWRSRFSLGCRRIGRITADAGHVTLLDGDGKRAGLAATGYEHFRTDHNPHP